MGFLMLKGLNQTNVMRRGQSFLYLSFYRTSRPNFLKIEKKNNIFSILFLYFPPIHASTVLEINSVFLVLSFPAARLIKLPPVTAPGEILPF